MQQLHQRLRALRKQARLTLQAAAAGARLTVGHLSDVERGRVALSLAALQRLADVYGMSLSAVLADVRIGPPPAGPGAAADDAAQGGAAPQVARHPQRFPVGARVRLTGQYAGVVAYVRDAVYLDGEPHIDGLPRGQWRYTLAPTAWDTTILEGMLAAKRFDKPLSTHVITLDSPTHPAAITLDALP